MIKMISFVNRNRRSIQNASALYLVQFSNFGISFLIVPFLFQRLGVAGYGTLGFLQNLGGLLLMLIDYGFYLTSTREASINFQNAERLAFITSRTTICKLLIGVCLLPLVTAIFIFIPNRIPIAWVLIVYAWSLAQSLALHWLFQALELLLIPVLLETAMRIMGAVVILTMVHNENDIPIVFIVFGVSSLSSTLAMYFIYLKTLKLRLYFIPLSQIWLELKANWNVFTLRLISTQLGVLGGLLLGWITPAQVAGSYYAAERITRTAMTLTWPLTQLMIPKTSRQAMQSKLGLKAINLKFLRFTLLPIVVISLSIALLAQPLLTLPWVFGIEFQKSVPILQILTLMLPLSLFANLFCYQWLVAAGHEILLIPVYIASMIVLICGIFLLVHAFSGIGMAWAVVLAEAVVCIGAWINLHRTGLLSSQENNT